jgi:hypothetical protein
MFKVVFVGDIFDRHTVGGFGSFMLFLHELSRSLGRARVGVGGGGGVIGCNSGHGGV